MHPVLTVEHLKKVYGKKNPYTAVDSISFDLKEGEILGLLGPNGSGKTTTIQMLLGTLSPTSGTISYFQKSFTTHRSEILKKVSFASTYTSLPHVLTIMENLRCFAWFYEVKEWKKKALTLLERFGIAEAKNRPVSSLSAGQVTRLMIVKAFFIEPKIVLLDEPTASLDPEISVEVCNFLLEERAKKGVSILFTSHKMGEVAEICDRTIFLKKGKIMANDLPSVLAKSVSGHQLRLTIIEGMEKMIALADRKKIPYVSEKQNIQFSLPEKEIPLFLQSLTEEKISYISIQIKEPSLEDYFLQLAGKKR
ncbi:MAG TPA: ABC transporter ATP-binding protein [Chlamydiales bacterium]|nr:ABC transporter ATP-binding protein [Chlamydiales bacterium]